MAHDVGVLSCSFCTARADDCSTLIQGPGVSICRHCVEDCIKILWGKDASGVFLFHDLEFSFRRQGCFDEADTARQWVEWLLGKVHRAPTTRVGLFTVGGEWDLPPTDGVAFRTPVSGRRCRDGE
jgi:hypothetical protein